MKRCIEAREHKTELPDSGSPSLVEPSYARRSVRKPGSSHFCGAALSLVLLVFFLFPFALAQSGRQTPPPPKPQPPPQSQGRRPVTPPADETRPRRNAEDGQDDKPVKLKADLVTVITSVTDSAGNQVEDLTQ